MGGSCKKNVDAREVVGEEVGWGVSSMHPSLATEGIGAGDQAETR